MGAGGMNEEDDIERSFIACIEDFDDPGQEWRRLFSELYGTFFLVIVAAGGGMTSQAFPNTISRQAAAVAPAKPCFGTDVYNAGGPERTNLAIAHR